MKLSPEETTQLLQQYFNFTTADLNPVYAAPSVEVGARILDEVRAKVKKAYRQAALILHPDRTGGDVVKSEILAKLNILMAEIENWKVIHNQPQPMMRTVVFNSGGSTTSSGFTGSTVWFTW